MAFRKANCVALVRPRLLISATLASPIPQKSAFSRIQTLAASLLRAVSFLESLIIIESGIKNLELWGKTTQPTINGPAKEPRPTSSRPATSLWPFCQRFCSKEKSGEGMFEIIAGFR